MKFLLYNLAGGLIMLAAVIGLFVVSSESLGEGTFYCRRSGPGHAASDDIDDYRTALFLGFFVAFAIKAPLWPFTPGCRTRGGGHGADRGPHHGGRGQGRHLRDAPLLPGAVPERQRLGHPVVLGWRWSACCTARCWRSASGTSSG